MDVAAPSAPCSSLRVSAGASYRCSGLKMDAAALSALQLAPLYLCLWFEDGCSSNVCCQDLRTFASGLMLDVASLCDDCRQELRTFASGLKMDVPALSALQLATFVGRSFVPLPLV